jgi:hypothetical protein
MKRLAFSLLLAFGAAHAQLVDLTANVQGVLPVTNGGTGNAAGLPQAGSLGYADTGLLGYLQGSLNGYLQFPLQNASAGSNASADFIVNNNLSTATTFYGDFGINSSNFIGAGSFALPNATYLYSSQGDLSIGTYSGNAIHFVINNGATDALTIGSVGNATFAGRIAAPGLPASGTIANALCADASGNFIANSGGNCYASAIYPGAGIANSTGSAWGASYGVSGSGSVCLTTSCVMTTPALGTPASGVMTNVSGTAAGLTAGAANGLKSATTTVATAAATAPVSGQVLTATSATTAIWQAPTGGSSLVANYISGFTLANDATTPNTVLDVAAGYAADSTNTVMITGSAFTKTIGGTWVAGSGNAGMGTGLTVAASTWYHVFAIICGGSSDVYFDTSSTAANKPASTTAYRYIGSFKTDASAHILAFFQFGQEFLWAVPVTDMSLGGTAFASLYTFTTPLGVVTSPILYMEANYSSNISLKIWGPSLGTAYAAPPMSGQSTTQYAPLPATNYTNTSSQLYVISAGTSGSITLLDAGYINPHVAPNF